MHPSEEGVKGRRRRHDGGDDNALPSEAKALRVQERAIRETYVVGIVGRLAQPHADDIAQGRHATRRGHSLSVVRLRKDLVGSEVAEQSHAAGGAEDAALTAAYLRRDAQRRARARIGRHPSLRWQWWDKHSLHLQPIRELEKQLLGTVSCAGLERHGCDIIERAMLQRERQPLR